MLKQLKIENFTVFPKADLQFASGLNVIVGENGCGKSHLLKLAYSFIAKGSVFHGNRGKKIADTEFKFLSSYADKLVNVFHIESLHELIKKQPNKINNKGFRAKLNFSDSNLDCTFNYYKHGKLGGELDLELYPKEWNP
ncbi:MAG: AAA family ATPase, partial [Cocleimonas sp.]|nr:AAA family ATPase [Cocleimonas sp.]